MYCNCKTMTKSTEGRMIETEVCSEGICVYCGHYAVNSLYKHKNEVSTEANNYRTQSAHDFDYEIIMGGIYE